ncbi:MAG: iron-siderophore ABC transporter substrate-binding protein [Merismopedia sp. SIO2A8]|nr:iron-siderophore ABC transporter substrate-binding protein [Symploca sp. SIO2B6]NET49254.1 iron-siderophore ABC transporter substrate-binding protein [Merismopedia sp. SIO2A8]
MRVLIPAFLSAACHTIVADPLKQPEVTSPSSLPPADCRSIEHQAGKTELCGQPQRIVTLGPSALEHLLALEMQPIGFSDHVAFHQGDYDNPRQQIPYLGSHITQPLINLGVAERPSLEAILKAEPDLIIGTEFQSAQYEVLSEIAPTIVLNREASTESLTIVAQAVDRTEQAEALLIGTEQRIVSTRETLAPVIASHPKVLLLVATQLQEIVLGQSHPSCSSPIEAMGFQLVSPPTLDNVTPDVWTPISLETLPGLNDADLVIILGANLSSLEGNDNFEDHQLSGLKQAWEENAIAQSLDASKAGRVYFIPVYLCAGLPGPIGTELYLKRLQKQLLAPD